MGPMGMPDISSLLNNPAMMQMVSVFVILIVYLYVSICFLS